MSLKDDLDLQVYNTYSAMWTRREGRVVPESSSIQLGNDGVDIEAALLYADLASSTQLVDRYTDWFAAEQYKVFLLCASQIIRAESGEIRSYDGDRVMGVFIGNYKRTNAVKAALKINWAMNHIIRPRLTQRFPNSGYLPQHTVGIDCTSVFGVRAGIRGNNDIAWIGRCANYAAKLSSLRIPPYTTWITGEVYDCMDRPGKHGADGSNMWAQHTWRANNDLRIFGSNFEWPLT